jgi:hypothetical protein
MPSLPLFEVIERIPSLYSKLCGSVVGPCTSHETSLSFRLVKRPSAVPVMYLHVASLLGATTPILVNMDSL